MNGHDVAPASELEPKVEQATPPHRHQAHRSPFHRYPGQHTKWIKPDGESYRRGVHPLKFIWLCFRSSNKVSATVNVLWPVVPAAIAVHFARPDWHLAIFVLNYIAMVPAANLIGYAGQELARKLPKVFGVLLETTLGSMVEIILFIVLISRGESYVAVVRAAILGSILANLLLCLGLCFTVGGLRSHDEEQSFHAAVSEVGSGLMLVAGSKYTVRLPLHCPLLTPRSGPCHPLGIRRLPLWRQHSNHQRRRHPRKRSPQHLSRRRCDAAVRLRGLRGVSDALTPRHI